MFANAAVGDLMLLHLSRILAALALIVMAGAATAQEASGEDDAARVALVIGNGAYVQAPIEDAVEGARSVADALRQGDFQVLYLENASRADIQQGLAAFAKKLERGASGIVFYAGHAVQHQGRNYLVALDTKITGPDNVRREAVDIDLLLDPLIVARTPGSAVILDASRANPWQPLLPGGHRGLADPDSVKGISFVCSAAPGKVVKDSPQASAVFAQQLAQAMKTPELDFNDVVSRTRSAVARINGRDQRVWQSETRPDDLVITSASRKGGAKPADAVELGFWDTIKTGGSAADYQAYLSAYPNGQFALIARSKLAQLQPKTAAVGTPAATAPAVVGAPAPTPPAGAPPAAVPNTRPTAATRPDQFPPAAGVPAPAAPPPAAASTMAPKVRDCSVCPELVAIPAGTLTMGSTDVFAFEGPVREVAISKPFYIGRREVTFDEWDACVAEGGCQHRPGDRGQGRGLRPVSDLDWNDAKAYVAWLTRKTGKVYRLPTEAEWEYAARAGTKTAFYWGGVIEKDRANCAGCTTSALNKTVETGTFPPNAFGLFDMAGNVAEWVEDCWEDSYKAAPRDGAALTKPDCRERVLRGGSFNNDQRFVRTAARFKYDYDVRYYTNGFRVVRER
jgi:formylglycine-generating enzyme required for sulfatase activity